MFLCGMKKILVALALLSSCLLFAFSASAQQQAPVVAIVDLQGIIRSSQAADSVRQQLSEKLKIAESEIKALENDLNKDREALIKQRPSLSEDAFTEKKGSLESKLSEASREVGLKRRSLDIAYRTAGRKIEDKVVQIIESIASERGATLVMNSAALILFDPAMDITNEVLDQVNAELPSVTLEIPAE